MRARPDGYPPPPSERKSIPELKALGRSKVIEIAREVAMEVGSRIVPADNKGVKVVLEKNFIRVVLAKGYRAYDCHGTRRIETYTLEVHFQDFGPSVQHEGDQVMTEKDQEVLDFVLKNMPPNYEFVELTIIDDPQEQPDGYIVQVSSEHTMGSHTVDRKTGEWTYVGHKHFARRPKAELWEEETE
jgi:hypothetical protein